MNIPFTLSGLINAGLTQAQIGVAIGLKQSSISAMKAGREGVTRPSSRVVTGLKLLAKKHRVSIFPPTQ